MFLEPIPSALTPPGQNKALFAGICEMLYSGTMNRFLGIAVVAFLILLILAIFISPAVDSVPSALRAQQWLSLIVAMFSFSLQLIICTLKLSFRISLPHDRTRYRCRIDSPDLTCCLLC